MVGPESPRFLSFAVLPFYEQDHSGLHWSGDLVIGSILVLGGLGAISDRPEENPKSVLFGAQFTEFVNFQPLLCFAQV